MGHTSVGSGGLLLLVIASALLLALFVIAAIRAPAEVNRPDPEPAAPPEPAPSEPAPPPPPLPRRRIISPPADAVTQNSDAGYPPRHAAPGQTVSGGPPWEPAPKPPGVDRDDAW
jgi:periplasmic protein TonB